jgi:long-subunit fatty acid transport protein
MGVLAGGTYRNSTPYAGNLESNAGTTGSAAFGVKIPGSPYSFGIGTFPVSRLTDRWKFQDPPGTAGASYGIQTNKSAFIAIQSSVGLGMQISPKVSIGAALGVVYNINTLSAPYIFQTNPTLAGLKTLLHLNTNGLGYNGTFGLIAEPTRRFKFGLAYKTQTTVHSNGRADGDVYAQFAALGLPYASSFHYQAEVDNVFPQTASVSLAWQAMPRLQTYLQTDWLNWRKAFVQLPVHLTGGNNALLNTLLNSTSLNDTVPLRWKNQMNVRAGFELSARESVTFQGAYSYGNSPVPNSTLTPLTAAIMTHGLSAGAAYQKSRYRIQLAYQVNLPQSVDVGTSSILAGEFNNTHTSLWLQTIALTTGVRF